MKRILIWIIVIFFTSCNDYRLPLEKRAYPPEKAIKLGGVLNSLKSADLKYISINDNVEIRELSLDEQRKQIEAALNGETISEVSYLKIHDQNLLLDEIERTKMVKEIEEFYQVSNLKIFKYHKYTSYYCNESIKVEKWTVKDKYARVKDLNQIVIYSWIKKKERFNYYQSYIKITKKGNPQTLEIFENDPHVLTNFKLNGKSVKILENTKGTDPYLVPKRYNQATDEILKQQFFDMILSCN